MSIFSLYHKLDSSISSLPSSSSAEKITTHMSLKVDYSAPWPLALPAQVHPGLRFTNKTQCTQYIVLAVSQLSGCLLPSNWKWSFSAYANINTPDNRLSGFSSLRFQPFLIIWPNSPHLWPWFMTEHTHASVFQPVIDRLSMNISCLQPCLQLLQIWYRVLGVYSNPLFFCYKCCTT